MTKNNDFASAERFLSAEPCVDGIPAPVGKGFVGDSTLLSSIILQSGPSGNDTIWSSANSFQGPVGSISRGTRLSFIQSFKLGFVPLTEKTYFGGSLIGLNPAQGWSYPPVLVGVFPDKFVGSIVMSVTPTIVSNNIVSPKKIISRQVFFCLFFFFFVCCFLNWQGSDGSAKARIVFTVNVGDFYVMEILMYNASVPGVLPKPLFKPSIFDWGSFDKCSFASSSAFNEDQDASVGTSVLLDCVSGPAVVDFPPSGNRFKERDVYVWNAPEKDPPNVCSWLQNNRCECLAQEAQQGLFTRTCQTIR